MSDEYLWKGGVPEDDADEEVLRLEKLLGQFRYREPRPRPVRFYAWMAAAAALLLSVGTATVFRLRGPFTDWQLNNGQKLRVGAVVESGAIESQFTGHVEVEPNSRLRIVSSGQGEQRFDLERGTIHALIWAPPGRFVVDTPSAKTTDLGCRYTLQVSSGGQGLVTVETGWVAFEWQNREAFIPAGAACVTRPKLGPGTPWFQDAPEALKAALQEFDTKADSGSLQTALRAAREHDALTVWHLMARTSGVQRSAAYDRFASLVRLPPNVTRTAVLNGDAAAIDGAWNALDLGSTEWWREWKRKW